MRFLILFLFSFQNLTAQISEKDILGLWEVAEVTVGERTMTPIAKWAEFTADHRHRGGNGWQQHTVGDWSFNAKNAELTVLNDNGIKDEYGAFKISFSDEKMLWQREEEGMLVNVVLKKSKDLPQAHWDKIIGLWVLESMEGDEMEDGFFAPEKLTLYFGWDRRFFFRHGSFRSGGKWHAHAHRPQIETFDDAEKEPTVYSIDFSENKMTMTHEKEGKKLTLIWRRIHEFPKE